MTYFKAPMAVVGARAYTALFLLFSRLTRQLTAPGNLRSCAIYP